MVKIFVEVAVFVRQGVFFGDDVDAGYRVLLAEMLDDLERDRRRNIFCVNENMCNQLESPFLRGNFITAAIFLQLQDFFIVGRINKRHMSEFGQNGVEVDERKDFAASTRKNFERRA